MTEIRLTVTAASGGQPWIRLDRNELAGSVLRNGFFGRFCQSVGWTNTDEHGQNGEGVCYLARPSLIGAFGDKSFDGKKAGMLFVN